MRGPSPKPPELVQRANKASSKAILPAAGTRRRPPPLPAGCEWGREARAWFKDVWASPMAAEYLQVDTHGLYMLGYLIDLYWRRPSTKLASEIRQQGAAYGLSPLDRRRLQWSVERVESRRQRRAPTSTGEDPRDVLRVVE